jgi:polyribonucleotide nucleotidyltransferase
LVLLKGGHLSVSERQLELIKEAAEILISESRLTKEEAIQLISGSIKKELVKRGTTMEALNISPKPDRTSYIRAVVQHVQEGIQANPYWRTRNIDKLIETFYKALHDSWQREK